MGEAPQEDLQTTLQLVKRQLELERTSRKERERKEAEEKKARQDAIADEVEAEVKREKERIRRLIGIVGVILSSLIGLFSWSYSVIKEAQQKEIEDAQRKTRVDIELKAAVDATVANAKKLSDHTKDFDKFQQEQREQDRVQQMEELHQSRMMEKTLRSLGKTAPSRSKEHEKAAKAVGWDLDEDDR